MIQGPVKRPREAALDNLLSRVASKLFNIWLRLTYPFASIGKKTWLHHSCELARSVAKYIKFGNNVYIARNFWIHVVHWPETHEPIIIIEDGCQLGRGGVILAQNRIHIGRNTSFGPSVFVTDHNHQYEDPSVPIILQGTTQGGTVRIEEGSWIGYGAAIIASQGELVIGRNSVIGANAVVTRSVAPYSIVSGNPARPVMHYDHAKEKWELGGGVLERQR